MKSKSPCVLCPAGIWNESASLGFTKKEERANIFFVSSCVLAIINVAEPFDRNRSVPKRCDVRPSKSRAYRVMIENMEYGIMIGKKIVHTDNGSL